MAGSAALTGRTAWARNLAAPVRDFMNAETGGATILLAAVVVALAWANSPWSDSYESAWTTTLAVRLGDHGIAMDLRHWVNQGLMTFFFLVIGLEAKRELDVGALRERRRVALPALAALGGTLVPIAIYLAINAGGDGAGGWGAAMSTDTAFALGVLGLVAPRGTRLRVALLTTAVVDDLLALLVIAVAYTTSVDVVALVVAIVLFGGVLALRFASPAWRLQAAAVLGVGVWVALDFSGVDPVVAGLAVGLATAAYPPGRAELESVTDLVRSFREQPTPQLARSAQRSVVSAISPNERLQYRLHPWTSYVIVPLFALANAGIHVDGGLLGDALRSPVTLGIFLGYVVGKPLGIVGAAWLGSRPAFNLRRALSWPAIVGNGMVAGIGFTVALLVASLAFEGRQLAEAKVGILLSAIVAALLAWVAFRVIARIPQEVRARQLSGTAAPLLDLAEDVDPGRDHIRGPADAVVTLVEYGDYECPYCGQAEEAIRSLLRERDDLRYVWRHLPLADVHPDAQRAAESAEAAHAQGRFWEMHDRLFTHQDDLGPRTLLDDADALGLDVERFAADLRGGEHAERVSDDVGSADASGVAGTPTFFVNGIRYEGAYDTEALTAAVNRAHRAAEARAVTAAPA